MFFFILIFLNCKLLPYTIFIGPPEKSTNSQPRTEGNHITWLDYILIRAIEVQIFNSKVLRHFWIPYASE